MGNPQNIVWNALHTYRDDSIPEGIDNNDENWEEICEAMRVLTGDVNMHLLKHVHGHRNVMINGKDLGVIELFEGEEYRFFPRRQELISGDDWIAIGHALNKLNHPD